MRSMRLFSVLLVLSALIQGCLVSTQDIAISPEIRSAFEGTYKVEPYLKDHMPRTVAVLPFIDKSGSKEGATVVRKGFFNHFSSLAYKDMELYRVDRLLMKEGLSDPVEINKKTPQEIGKILGVDGVIYGDISNFDKLFAGLYSQVSVGAEVRMYDSKSGHFLWSGKHVARIHEGGISTTPVGIIATLIATSMNVRDIQLLRACDDLFRDMVKTVPQPTVAEALRPPVISLLTHDAKGKPRKAGTEIKVVVQGTPGLQAFFDLGDYKKGIDMKEVEPGGYLGTYRVVPGDNIKDAIITGHLVDNSGNKTDWVDALGTVTLKTTPPAKPKLLPAVGRNTAIYLKWEKNADADLVGYKLYRSPTPLEGFQEIARTEFNEYRDAGLVNSQKYFYRATALDSAGNESQKTDAIAAMPVDPGPTRVSGVVETDTTWYAGASPYVIEDTVVVKDKAVLTIEPGAEIRSKGKGIVIEGSVRARGDKESMISFDAVEGAKWEGIRFRNVKEKENLLRFTRIRNAVLAVGMEASSPAVDSCEITGNEDGIQVSGAFSKPKITATSVHGNKGAGIAVVADAKPVISESKISDNGRGGIVIQNGAPRIERSTIIQNRGTGIKADRSQAVITLNNIYDNKPLDMEGMAAGEAVSARDNWWGDKGIGVFKRIKGRIDALSILNAPYPEGKPVDLPILGSTLDKAISTDAFLILSNSPYRVTRNIAVEKGAILSIEPGVFIQYNPGTAIVVSDGAITARGTAESPIVFTAAGASPSPGAYHSAVRFEKAAQTSSSFEYCVIKFAETGIDVLYGTPDIHFSQISDSSQCGIAAGNDATPKITYNTFLRNHGQGAISCQGRSIPLIRNNNFVQNDFEIQALSTKYIDARNNWWGEAPPNENSILKDNDNSINIKPWLNQPEPRAYKEAAP